jgi:hypothetical protein
MRRHSAEPQDNKMHIYMEIYIFAFVRYMDRYLLWHQLSLPQQCNCVEGFYNRPTQLLPKGDVAVAIWGNKITDDISHTIRFQASKEAARKYWGNEKKNLWLNEKCDEFDWEHLDLALKNKPNMNKTWRSK